MVGVIGTTIFVLGVVMLVTPGPAMLMIPVGLAVLSIEFAWARLWLKKLRESISNHNNRVRAGRAEAHRKRTGP